MKHLFKRVSPFFWIFFVIIIAGSILFALFPPLVLERIINDFTLKKDVIWSMGLVYFAMLALSGLFDTAKEILITKFGQKVTHQLRSMMCAKLSRLPASYFTSQEPGVIVSRFTNDANAVDSLFTNGIISMGIDAFKIISILIVIFCKSLGLGFIMLIVTPLLYFMTRYIQKKMLHAQLQNRSAIAKVNNIIPETIKNLRMIQSFGKQKYMENRYDSYIEQSYKAMDESNVYDSIYSPIVIMISSVIVSILMILSAMGGHMTAFFGMQVGTAVAIISYVDKIFAPIESMGMEIQNIQSAVAGYQRIKEFVNTPEQSSGLIQTLGDLQEAAWISAVSSTEENLISTVSSTEENLILAVSSQEENLIRIDHVTFGYTKEELILKDINIVIKKGESVTLTGHTGAGKSTLFKLLLGLYPPDCGEIKIGNQQAKDIPNSEKRKIFGYVEQSFHLVKGSVLEQISLFDTSISKDDIIQAAKLVGLHESILSLEHGYDTPANEKMFSQGQFQLLSIARAIVSNPPILLLDEITANLDSDTENDVIEKLKLASQNRTVISISHRLYEKTTNGRLINI